MCSETSRIILIILEKWGIKNVNEALKYNALFTPLMENSGKAVPEIYAQKIGFFFFFFSSARK